VLTDRAGCADLHNIVLVRLVSRGRFKQIIGRGTRVRDDYGKLWFNILDYIGTATHNFADRAFDGDPAFATEEEIDEYGRPRHRSRNHREREDNEAKAKGQTRWGQLAAVIVTGRFPERRNIYF